MLSVKGLKRAVEVEASAVPMQIALTAKLVAMDRITSANARLDSKEMVFAVKNVGN